MASPQKGMESGRGGTLGRRELLSYALPVCGAACLGLGGVERLSALTHGKEGTERSEAEGTGEQSVHPFDVKTPVELSARDRTRMQYRALMAFIASLREDLGDDEVVRLLNHSSATQGRAVGEALARRSPDTTFRTFTAVFRPPAYRNTLVHEVVEDTDDVFQLRVTECVWAAVFKEAGLDGAIGHAAVCNMDYSMPPAFNPRFRMERTHTLMQGDDHCDHRYIQAAQPSPEGARR